MQPVTHLQGKASFSHSLPLFLLPIHAKLSPLFSVTSILIIAMVGSTIMTRCLPCPPAAAFSWDLKIPVHQARHVPVLHSPTACSWCVFQTYLAAKHQTLIAATMQKLCFKPVRTWIRCSSREGTFQCSIPHRTKNKERGGEWLLSLFFVLQVQKACWKVLYELQAGQILLSKIHMWHSLTWTRATQKAEGTAEIRVFRFLY